VRLKDVHHDTACCALIDIPYPCTAVLFCIAARSATSDNVGSASNGSSGDGSGGDGGGSDGGAHSGEMTISGRDAYYRRLGLTREATAAQIKTAYRALAMKVRFCARYCDYY
jgi:hypothetical protein